jgi:hypothetical protein
MGYLLMAVVVEPIRLRRSASQRGADALKRFSAALFTTEGIEVPPPPPSLSRSEKTMPKYMPDEEEEGAENRPLSTSAKSVRPQSDFTPRRGGGSFLSALFSSSSSPSSSPRVESPHRVGVRWKPSCPEQDISTYPEWIEAERLGRELAQSRK